ncbi:MAG: tRNA (guanine-N7-)-methyltransferase [Cognaticolwellia sp.]|jgi:tRNA (guanine-N7-)-methyltransferase
MATPTGKPTIPMHHQSQAVPEAERLYKEIAYGEYIDPDHNPYLNLHRSWGRPVLTSEQSAACRGAWEQEFGRKATLNVEIGTGNGFFFSGMAESHPDQNWLGIEIRFKRVILTAKKLRAACTESNSRICRYDASGLTDLFVPGEIDTLYINHPDPWDKERWAKNRLLGPDFLDRIAILMSPGAELRIKTDHLVNVKAVLEHIAGRPFELFARCDDVSAEGAPWAGDIVTNYQRKFDERGLPVYALRLRRL